jgi:predicted enzyme related to lactoylglutathione lyase
MPIIGMHALIYSKQAEEARRLFQDALGWRSVDAGRGWLIFAAPPTELAIHPAEDEEYHELYLMCDDITATVAELKKKGIETTRAVRDQGWGLVTAIRLPSGAELGLYEPRHPMAIARPRAPKRAPRRSKRR